MSEIPMDIVTVAHRDETWTMMLEMFRVASTYHPMVKVIPVDNREENRGFAAGCNLGAKAGDAPIIGFLNPDVIIDGPFLEPVQKALAAPQVVITGERYGKPQWEINHWGCHDWVCGACFFVKRAFFEDMGGFDERYVWGWEETDLIRRAQQMSKTVRSIHLPIRHTSPTQEPTQDSDYKARHFAGAARIFKETWG